MGIRSMAVADVDQVLPLNEASVQMLSPLDEAGMDWHRRTAAAAVVYEQASEVLAFALAYAPGAPYESVNYRWHSDHFGDFLYLDRIAVRADSRRQRIGSALYDHLETIATEHGRMVCEVSCDNEESLAFHHRRGYRPMGQLRQADGHETVMLEKTL